MNDPQTFAYALPPALLQTCHWIAGLIVMAEALNKLERTQLFRRGLCLKARLVIALKLLGWTMLALGGAGALITPFLLLNAPTLRDTVVLVGFAILIIRTRVQETL